METRFPLLLGSMVAAVAAGLLVSVTVSRGGDQEADLIALRAEAGDPESLFRLGVMHAEGIEVARDEAKAIELWEEAALRGHTRSMSALGWAYLQGIGVDADAEYGESWFRRAADLGDADSMMTLGQRSLDAGRIEDAAVWTRLASVGRPQFADYADAIRSRLDAKGREEVERRCGEWIASHATIALLD